MKKTYEMKVITVIFKSGETATFEHCLDVYTESDLYFIMFPGDEHILMQTYSIYEVAMIANGYIDKLEVE